MEIMVERFSTYTIESNDLPTVSDLNPEDTFIYFEMPILDWVSFDGTQIVLTPGINLDLGFHIVSFAARDNDSIGSGTFKTGQF